jgi:hypothetical protein
VDYHSKYGFNIRANQITPKPKSHQSTLTMSFSY